ncbi:sensor domain-containing protein [Brevibacillus migulae]|uniref:sensor domain-containing protein n=1 Tax=Brevibacillus migulae TaxID=1644114 RepID=UPI00106E4001|nr:EAL domain-containing protein [Brevibacillus migulae]
MQRNGLKPVERQNVHFQTILNASPDIIVLKDAQGRWVEANKRTLEIFQIDEEVYRGKTELQLGEIYPHFEIYVPYFIESDRLAWVTGDQIQAEEYVIIDGEEHVFNVVKVPIYDSNGEPDALVVIGRDITEIRKSEQIYKSIFSDHPEGVYSLDKEGNFLDINKEAQRISGYSREELLQTDFQKLIAPDKLPAVLERFEQVLKGQRKAQITQLVRKDGQVRDIQLTTIPATLNGKVIGIHGVAQDVTETKRLEVLREKETFILAKIASGDTLEEVINHIIEIVEKLSQGVCSIMFYEKEQNWLRFGYGPGLNPEFVEKIDKFPVGPDLASCGHAAYVKELTIVSDIETNPAWAEWSEIALRHGMRSCWSVPVLSASGSLLGTFAVYYHDSREPDDIEISMLRVFAYVTGLAMDRTQHIQEIQYLANHDVLTNLPNLRYLKELFEQWIQETNELAVMFLDLDHFKTLNDTFGHDFGDILIQEIAGRIQKTIGEANVVARMGGDEFVILIRNVTDRQMVREVAEHILTSIEKPIFIMDRDFHVTASIGISMYGEHGSTIEALMKNADVAMYSVKDAGGNGSRIYDPAMNEKAYELYMLQGEFRKALEQEQFQLYYQPKYDIRTGAITGLEALVRWIHPEKGVISPATFIPLAEESGFIIELGAWVLRRACQQVKEWKDESNIEMRVAVNVSVKQFIKQDIAAYVKATLDELKLDPGCLELEITESVLSRHEFLIQETVGELQRIGVKVSIDDFGTGYASLTYLKQFRANTIKIDRSFIQLLPQNEEDSAIVTAIITLANQLNMSVIAEGVETKEQLDFLRSKGCNEVQGYYFSPPLPVEKMYHMLKENRLSGGNKA